MNFVEPIREIKKISQIKNILKSNNNIRDLLLFELGINSALRISDLLSLKIGDLFENSRTIKDFFDIKEIKTNKNNRITITSKVKETLKLYRETYPDIIENKNNFVFFQKKSFPLGNSPISRKMSWVILSKLCDDIGLKGNFGNHTLRKTWGYQARMNNIPLEIIQHKLNHSSLSITMRYLGITADEIMDACNKLDL
ncbi:MAG: tyrosine-type recombinase/integrase [Candidatus Gracilibacteria bacterium]|nr:tyrosine-type recombinase/integrase [Candidatus Gracilibacteria bacterium]